MSGSMLQEGFVKLYGDGSLLRRDGRSDCHGGSREYFLVCLKTVTGVWVCVVLSTDLKEECCCACSAFNAMSRLLKEGMVLL